ncbi:IS66 family insertion sequence element accessory protein TnpA [Alkaliphilus hydrothermalis]|uniref:Transposase-like protein n=1 Tax=Alkaliphilus hydrothermalis TaxID=1482730 RepID=A0ABS2NQP4_9FIRM|nr:hypothetical protein [Alkaliphilus hydrothermalis]MBM7615156.1 transposase-like protein [Alkaliphilus hydrothermalis]
MDMREVNHQVRINEWRQIISECRSSGKTIRDWCKENSIKSSQYYYWLRVIRNESVALVQKELHAPPATFAAVEIREEDTTYENKNDTCAVVKGQGFSVEIKNGANIQTLEQTLRILGSLC